MTIVMKFGGTSVGSSDSIKNVSQIIQSHAGEKPIVVVSAVGGITDKLIEVAEISIKGEDYDKALSFISNKQTKIIKELGLNPNIIESDFKEFVSVIENINNLQVASVETMDVIQSFGERMSSKIVAAYLTKCSVKAGAYNAYDIGMITDPEHGKAEPLSDTPQKLKDALGKIDVIPIVTGFIGMTPAGNITTLGRGGSDYTAAIIGAAVKADEIQIWTDVDGIMTADPRVVKDAKTLLELSFVEAAELAYFGAKVLHPKTIQPAMEKDIPVRVLNTHNPQGKGTVIKPKADPSPHKARAVSCKKDITLVRVVSTRMLDAYGFLAKVFEVFDYHKVSVDMISTSEVSVSLTVDKTEHLKDVVDDLSGIADVQVKKDRSIVSVVGEGMQGASGIAGKIFGTLSDAKINVEMISQGASQVNVSFIVDANDSEKAVQVLHKTLFV